MARAVDLVTHESLAQALGGQLPDNPDALRGVRLKIANRVASTARKLISPFPYSPLTRVHSGGLAKSIQVVRAGEGLTLVAPIVRAMPRPRHTTGRRRP